MSTEAYADIPGFSGYRAHISGSIWSAWKLQGRGKGWSISDRWKKLKPAKSIRDNRNSYALRRDGDRKAVRRYGAQWVLMAFIGPCPDGMESCHNNGKCEDDALENIRYDTHLSNMQDAVKHGTRGRGEMAPNVKLTWEKVRAMRKYFADHPNTSFNELGRMNGVTGKQVAYILAFRSWKESNE